MRDECLFCKAPLEYLEKDILMECVVCHKREKVKQDVFVVIMYAMSAMCRGWILSLGFA